MAAIPEFDEDVSALQPRRHADLLRRIQHNFTELKLRARRRFALEREYIDWVRAGRKTTTVRYVKDAVDVPASLRLEVIPTSDFEKTDGEDRLAVDTYDILRICVKKFGHLDDLDGRRDGFADAQELKETLQKIYGPVEDAELVTIYHIRPIAANETRRVA